MKSFRPRSYPQRAAATELFGLQNAIFSGPYFRLVGRAEARVMGELASCSRIAVRRSLKLVEANTSRSLWHRPAANSSAKCRI